VDILVATRSALPYFVVASCASEYAWMHAGSRSLTTRHHVDRSSYNCLIEWLCIMQPTTATGDQAHDYCLTFCSLVFVFLSYVALDGVFESARQVFLTVSRRPVSVDALARPALRDLRSLSSDAVVRIFDD